MYKSDLIGLLLQTLPLQDGVECTIHMCADLEVVVLHHVVEHLDDVYLGSKLLAFVFSFPSQREVHEKSRRILHGVVRQVVSAGGQNLYDPSDDTVFNHTALGLFPKTELLECSKRILSQV